MISTELEEAMVEEQIKLLKRTMDDIDKELRKAEVRLWNLSHPEPANQMLRLAGRHVTDAVMVGGHRIDDADILALRKLVDFVAARLEEE